MFPLTSELFEFNKIIFIYLVAIFLFFFWLLKSFLEKKFIIKRTPLDIPILLFLSVQILSTLFSIDTHTSIFGYYGRFNGGLLSIIVYVFLFYGIVLFSDLIKKETLLKTSLLSSFLVILWGLPGKFGYDLSCGLFTGQLNNSCWTEQFRPAERIFSTLGQPNWLGAYLAINFFIGLYFLLRFRHSEGAQRPRVFLYSLYLLVNFTAILFTRSRSALLAVFTGLIIFAVISIKKFAKDKELIKTITKRFIPVIAGIVVAVLLFKTGINKIDRLITYQKAPSSTESVETGSPLPSEVTESLDIRKIVWKGAWNLGLKHPFFGTGVETFAYSYYFARPLQHNLTSEWDYLYNKAHNEYLNYLATTGFLGLGTYLLLIVAIFIIFYKNYNRYKDYKDQLLTLCLFLAYLTILITNFFGFSTTTISLFFYLIPAIVIANGMKQSEKKINNKASITLLTAGSLVTLYLLIGLFKYFFADIKYQQSRNYSTIGDYQNASVLLSQALNLRKEHVYQDKFSSALANYAFLSDYNKAKEGVNELINLSKTTIEAAIKASPKNLLYWKTKGRNHLLYSQITSDKNDINIAIAAYKEALKLGPTDPRNYYALSTAYSFLDSQELSISAIDKSIELKPDYRDGYLLKAQLLKKYGRNQEAKQILEYYLQKINPQDKEFKQEVKSL